MEETTTEVNLVQRFFFLRVKSSFLERERRHKDNQQKTYDNETEEHTGGQRPIFIPDGWIWQTKTEGTDKASGQGYSLVNGKQCERTMNNGQRQIKG